MQKIKAKTANKINKRKKKSLLGKKEMIKQFENGFKVSILCWIKTLPQVTMDFSFLLIGCSLDMLGALLRQQ